VAERGEENINGGNSKCDLCAVSMEALKSLYLLRDEREKIASKT